MAEDGGWRTFAGPPQPVEIHHRGIWYSGELLGWRHDADGRVLARVRCVVDRLRHSAWKDFAELRLPDPADPPRSALAGPSVPEDGDDTRPHVLLAHMGGRPATPEHVSTPPARRVERPARPRWEPAQPPGPRAAPPSAPERRLTTHPERRKTNLSAV